jgi:hypothetical protein
MSSLLLIAYTVITIQELRSYKVPHWETFMRRKHSEEATSANLPLPATTPVPVEDIRLVSSTPAPAPAVVTTATDDSLEVPTLTHSVARPSSERVSVVLNAHSDIGVAEKRLVQGRRPKRKKWVIVLLLGSVL